jgi:hypothetical protein
VAAAKAEALHTVTGRVRDARGSPCVSVQVIISAEQQFPRQPSPFTDSAVTDREGVFVLAGIPRNALKISLSQARYQSQDEELPEGRDEVEYTYRREPNRTSEHLPAVHRDDPIPADVRTRFQFVDLSRYGTDCLADGPGGSGNDLHRLPRGLRALDGLYFQVAEDIVHLVGTMAPDLPREVKGIKVQSSGRKLHFLHAVQYGVNPGTEVGAYVAHYADGSSVRIPLVYGRDLVNWWFDEVPSAARIVWTGSNDALEMNQIQHIRLFALTWTNPHPEKEIASLDCISLGTMCDPFMVAVTLETDK